MKTAKLIIGIISIVLSVVVFFQATIVGLGEAIFAEEEATSGGFGIVVAILMLIGGIVAICARKSIGGAIFCLIDYALAGLIGISFSANYPDLQVWGFLTLIFSGIFLLSLFVGRKTKNEEA